MTGSPEEQFAHCVRIAAKILQRWMIRPRIIRLENLLDAEVCVCVQLITIKSHSLCLYMVRKLKDVVAIALAAAVARKAGEPLVIEEVIVAPPKSGEVRLKIICTSLCYSDVTFWKLNVRTFGFPFNH